MGVQIGVVVLFVRFLAVSIPKRLLIRGLVNTRFEQMSKHRRSLLDGALWALTARNRMKRTIALRCFVGGQPRLTHNTFPNKALVKESRRVGSEQRVVTTLARGSDTLNLITTPNRVRARPVRRGY
jgi:hypothetical protein